MKRLFGVLILGASIVIGVLVLNLLVFIEAPAGNPSLTMTVERGLTLDQILQELEVKGVITNIPLFKAYVFLQMAANKIRAGDYSFPAQIRPRELLPLLLKGDFAIRRITIPEGWTAKEIASFLGNSGLVKPDLFLLKCRDEAFIRSLGLSVSNLEGYLYPDTYEIYRPKNEEEVLKRFIDRFQSVYAPEFEEKGRQMGLTQRDVVILDRKSVV